MNKLTMTMLMVSGMAGLALADTPKAPDAKAPVTAPAPAPKAPDMKAGAAMEMPKPPQEISDMAKGMGGSWNCDGTFHTPDGKTMAYKSTVKPEVKLDGWWIHETATIKGADAK